MKVLNIQCDEAVRELVTACFQNETIEWIRFDLREVGNLPVVDWVIIGPSCELRLEFARCISEWTSNPPCLIVVPEEQRLIVESNVKFGHGFGRNILTCSDQEEAIGVGLENIVDFLSARKSLKISESGEANYFSKQVSPRWLLNELLKKLPEYIYFKDYNSKFLAVSKYLAEISDNEDVSNVLGREDFDFFDENHSKEAFHDERLIAEGKEYTIQKEESVLLSETPIWVQSNKFPLVAQSGKPVGSFGISRDITIQKKLAEELDKRYQEIDNDIEMARLLQQSLIGIEHPRFDSANNECKVGFDVRYLPSDRLSGDFYRFVKTPHGNPAFLIADVMGHGVRAAMVTALIHAAMDQLHHLSDDPELFMKELNETLCYWLGNQKQVIFATAAYCLMDFKNESVEICQAGSDHVFIHDKQANPVSLDFEAINLALGLMSGRDYVSQKIKMNKGDTLFFYTDGIIEVENADLEPFGRDRLKEIVADAEKTDITGLLDNLLTRVQTFSSDANFSDDVTVAAIRIE